MKKLFLMLVLSIGLSATEIKLLTDRSDVHLKDLVEIYNKSTSDNVTLEFVKNGILERAKSGHYDVIISKGMYHYIDTEFKDIDYTWFNMSYRARAIFVRKGFKNPPMTYADLAKPEYKGKICIRSFTHNYNLELFGTMLSDMGTEDFTKWFKAFESNLARKPAGNDRNQVKGIYDGVCDIAIANTYYYGLMLDDKEQKNWANSVDMIIPDQGDDDNGAISLFSAVGVLSDSKKVKRFLEYLISDETQKYLSVHHHEYPLEIGNAAPDVRHYGKFTGVSLDTLKKHKNIQNDLFKYRKEVYGIIKDN
jgi:iron(III) transport system substrate-binding protein